DGHVTHIRIIKSSGYDILDQAIIQAINLAAPFSPLPDGFGKNRLVVTGSFRYILNSF
ncbi:energy transducer TonB, partial [Klebsiella pneumoniae]